MFQKVVFDKFIKSIDKALLEQKYQEFRANYQNPTKIEQIKNSKEEQYQEGFLRDVFVKILGYTINPEPNYNLITEKRNESTDKKDARKADGAIIINGQVKAVIELKGTDTTDLNKIENQALGYKAHNKGCRYIIISNFEKLRFYIDDVTEHIEFNLFTLDFSGFCELYTLLAYTQIAADIPAQIKELSLNDEEFITKKFYKDYSDFKNAIFTDICELNPSYDKLELFRKTQKLLDRMLFVLFCEDKGLLPANSVESILKRFKTSKENYIEKPLYDFFKQFFGWIDTGLKDDKMEIFAYNGGLFKSDGILDNIKISDEILLKYTHILANYDFDSQVSVDILGRIFEHSISEIESKENEIQGLEQENKRKKDGIFYTPAYITKYIVENTLGKLCDDKKTELGINDEKFLTSTKCNKNEKINILKAYRNYLYSLKICDPACGSGAFLNATLKFLKAEHRLIDEMENKLYGSTLDFSYYDNEILQNNIYGVDINGESVEIAKLALWLNTAQIGRKLSTLSNNIKRGNSLINSEFNWQEEFPEVFAKGGFDIIIGNPPYVQLQSMGAMSEVYSKCGFFSYNKSADLYCLFAERGFNLLKENGLVSFIMPNKWMLVDYGKELRKFFATTSLQQILNFGDIQFFQDATTYVCIFVTKKSQIKNNVLALSLNKKTYNGDFLQEIPNALKEFPNELFGENEWKIIDNISLKVLEKINTFTPLKSLPIEINYGIKTGFDEAFHIDENTKNELIAKDVKSAELIKPLLRGRDIKAWNSSFELYMINTHNGIKAENLEPINIDDYPAIKEHLSQFYDKLQKRGDKGITPYNLRNCAYLKSFDKPKIIYPEVTSNRPFSYDENGIFANKTCFILTIKDESISLKFLLAILNSKLANFWIWHNCPECQGGARNIAKAYFENFRIPNVSPENQKELANFADIMISLNKLFQKCVNSFFIILKANYDLEKISSALSEFYKLDFKEFLKISKIKVPISEQGALLEFFENNKNQCNAIKAQITNVENEINKAVYALYELTDDEIKAIENS